MATRMMDAIDAHFLCPLSDLHHPETPSGHVCD